MQMHHMHRNYQQAAARKLYRIFSEKNLYIISKRAVAFVCHVYNFIIIFRIKIQGRVILLEVTLFRKFRKLCFDIEV